jgi:peroxiredoxin
MIVKRTLAQLFVAGLVLCWGLVDDCDAQTAPWKQATYDVHGSRVQVTLPEGPGAVVFVFLSSECPISKSYTSQLNEMAGQWAKTPAVTLYGIVSDSLLTRQAAAGFAKEFELQFPVLFDESAALADYFEPTHVPEAFVVAADGQIAYRGRIDNRFADLGKQRQAATSSELFDAVQALVEGKRPAVTQTKPVGCYFETKAERNAASDITYYRNIAPLVQNHCLSCHRDGEVAPFPLANYEQVSKRSRQIARVVDEGLMPPWRAADPYGHFHGDRRLSPEQKRLFAAWSQAGAPAGDRDDEPTAPQFATGWQLGEPDMIIEMPEPFTVPADGTDVFQCFVLPLDLDEDHYCIAAEFRPGNKQVVHHSIMYLDHNGAARKRDQADPGPGYRTFGGPGFVPTGSVGGWSPGTMIKPLPDNLARYVKQGSDLVLQIHYHPTGKVETDRSSIGLHFIEKPSNIVAGLTVGNLDLDIPLGAKDYTAAAGYRLPQDVTLISISPHMHLIGRTMTAHAELPDGTRKQLLNIPDWHFYWQDQYLLEKPIKLPKGTILDVSASYDNSADNPFNPSHPPERVTYGEQTEDEMCFCFFTVTAEHPLLLIPLVIDNARNINKDPRAEKRPPSGNRMSRKRGTQSLNVD